MKRNKFLIIIICIIVIGAGLYGVYMPKTPQESSSRVIHGTTTYSDSERGFSFNYKTGPLGYILTEPEVVDPENMVQKILVLTQTADAEQTMTDTIPTETPPTITILILKNPNSESPESWAEQNPLYSNVDLRMGGTQAHTVSGTEGIRYTADGLYASEIIIVNHSDHIYIFKGGYLDSNTPLKKDFMELIDSVTFL